MLTVEQMVSTACCSSGRLCKHSGS